MLAFKKLSEICARSALVAALGGFTAAAATITPAPGTSNVSVSYSLTQSQADDYFVYHVIDSNGNIQEGANPLGPIVPGVTPNPAAFTLPYSVTSGYFTVLGFYSTGLVSVALNTTAGSSAVGQSFGSVFSGATEAALGTDLLTGDPASPGHVASRAAMVAFLDANAGLFTSFVGTGSPVSVSNVDFSSGTAAGGFTFSILAGPAASTTPEPSSFLLAAPGLLYLLRRKRV